jgi:integrase
VRLSRSASDETLGLRRDPRYASDGRVRKLEGYDAGQPPPPRPADSPGSELLDLEAEALTAELVVRQAPIVPTKRKPRVRWVRHLAAVLSWLSDFPGDNWEQRWTASGADQAPRLWAKQLEDAGRITRDYDGHAAMAALIHSRVIRPSYSFLLGTVFQQLAERFSIFNDPDAFARLRGLDVYKIHVPRLQLDAETCLTRVMIRTGKPLMSITGDDLLAYADLVRASGRMRREHLAWELMVELGPLAGEPPTLRAVWSAKGNSRQHSTEGLVDRYDVPAGPVRDLIVDYLNEIRPGLDYSTLVQVTHHLARLFWWTVLQVNPHQQDLHLDRATVTAWRERLAVTTQGRTRGDFLGPLFSVRAFYRDIQQWAVEDPGRWARWAAPSPVRDADVRVHHKHKNRVAARMQQRTRVLTDLLPALTRAATDRRDWSRRLLDKAAKTPHDRAFEVDAVSYRRHDPPLTCHRNARARIWASGPPDMINKFGLIDVTSLEADCFWAWAVIETLRLTGCRIEEVLELTQLSIRHYTPPNTGTVVPLLHIAPSKIDNERLIPMSPELTEVLLAVQRRAKAGQPQIPMSVRYDIHERLHGPPLPHLFARRVGARQEVLSNHYIRTILDATAKSADLSANGEPVTFTPHDFRRLFTTDAVGSGLPLHIAAALLGHLDLDTTRSYTAVFTDDVIAHHQKFITQRRASRASLEYRDPTAEEWAEFEQHFLLRRVELGDCFRPYGTPCVHEHACVRCSFLRVDPAQRPRLKQMQANTRERLEEAHQHQWLGEVAALKETLRHIDGKLKQKPQLGSDSG